MNESRLPSTSGRRSIAIDWSGAVSSAGKIWLAEVRSGELIRLEMATSRKAVIDDVISVARDSELVVGLDFAFSLPAWFLEHRGLSSAPELWALAAREAENWLADCPEPFWGKPGKRRPGGHDEFRRTDREVPPIAGTRPKSVFQIGGAGAVGTGSLRGMPFLRDLREVGFSIWPFDEPSLPVVVEIYPRLLTGAVNKSSHPAREAYLARHFPGLTEQMRERAASCEDAFDAAVSAMVMDARLVVEDLHAMAHSEGRLEGQIWRPNSVASGPPRAADWESLVSSMLPRPVSQPSYGVLVGGDPGEVVVEIAPEHITVKRFQVEWVGQQPTDGHIETARFPSATAQAHEVAAAIIAARADRISQFGWCSSCRRTKPPEWMHDKTRCQSCAERAGIVY